MSKEPNIKELNEKMDEILGYIRVQKWMGRIKIIVWTLLIIFLVIVPVYFAYSFLQAPSQYIDIPMLETMKQFLQKNT